MVSNSDAVKLKIVAIHGTGDEALLPDDARRWWQSESRFAGWMDARIRELRDRLSAANPQRPIPEVEIEWHRFSWSGANSKTARHVAGFELYEFLRELCKQTEKRSANDQVHVVAHSHGGNVLLEALLHASYAAHAERHLGPVESELTNSEAIKNKDPIRSNREIRQSLESADIIGKTLRTWTTVGTPFLELRKRNLIDHLLSVVATSAKNLVFFLPIFLFLVAVFNAVSIYHLSFWVPAILILSILLVARRARASLKDLPRRAKSRMKYLFTEENYSRVHAIYGRRWRNLFSGMDEAVTLLSRLKVDGTNEDIAGVSLGENQTGKWRFGIWAPYLVGISLSLFLVGKMIARLLPEGRFSILERLRQVFLSAVPDRSGTPVETINDAGALLIKFGDATVWPLITLWVLILSFGFALGFVFKKSIELSKWSFRRILASILRAIYRRGFGDDGGYGKITTAAETPGRFAKDGSGVGHFSDLRFSQLPDQVEEDIFLAANKATFETSRRLREALKGKEVTSNNADFLAFVLKNFNYRSLVHTSYFGSRKFVRMLAYGMLAHIDQEKGASDGEFILDDELAQDREWYDQTHSHYSEDGAPSATPPSRSKNRSTDGVTLSVRAK